ncbi:RNA-binding protein 34 [Thalassophryne amazonica]|uniref:RNA-binding protein 34 n=1 Tax=Thalassophryne amazonica TaxID=390379 RepID=UPI001471E211|nr:RNA-binding protein 34 [Thalassophryne amazonica]
MKKKQRSGAAQPNEPSADYVVGQVSGSLFQKNSAGSGSLLGLFSSSATPGAPVLFQPAPKPVQKSTEAPQKNPEVKGQHSQMQKKVPKEKTAAEQKLGNRESALLKADDDEREETRRGSQKTRRMKASREEETRKSQRTVFVGNLPHTCTKKMLQNFFRDAGRIESIRFRSVVREDLKMSRKVAAITRKVHPKKQNLNAYVVFKHEDGVVKALDRNCLEIEKDFYIRVDRITGSSSHDHKRSVFVGNLSFEIKELAFRRHFEECGNVEAVRLVRDKNTGLGKGFGYVLFESADSVQLALKLDGSKLEGRTIRVKRSVKKEKQKKKTEVRGPAKGQGRGSTRAPGPERGGGRGGFKPQRFCGNQQRSSQSSTSFKGQMVDHQKKMKKKGLKNKVKTKKAVHI